MCPVQTVTYVSGCSPVFVRLFSPLSFSGVSHKALLSTISQLPDRACVCIRLQPATLTARQGTCTNGAFE